MGCDIHAVFQAKQDGKWIDVPSKFEADRHYFLFSWLAGVRNGFGFAGVPTYTPITPIDEPRGLPADFDLGEDGDHPSEFGEPAYDKPDGTPSVWLGDHSHSWLTADEILSAPDPDNVWRTGVVPIEWFRQWDGHTPPANWSGGVFGGNVFVAPSPTDVDEKSTHVQICWKQPHGSLSYFTDEIKRLKQEYGEVRMIFGFDS